MKYFCDECKVHPAEKLHTLIAAHDCASFSLRLLIVLNILNYINLRLDVTPSST